jgi:hypothetical protein
MFVQWFLNTVMALVASLFAGLLMRIDPSRTPNSTEFQTFINVLFSHDIAHRGGSHDAPENTLCAFRKALQHGYKVMEIDIQFTAEGIPVGKFI